VSEGESPAKLDVARLLMTQGNVFVHLDPRTEGVVVPQWYRNEPQLVLQVGFEMPVPIPDLRIDEDGLYGTLSFNRSPFTCMVTWDAVFALAGDDGRGMVWPESMPLEISQEIEREAGRKPPPELVPIEGGAGGYDDEEASGIWGENVVVLTDEALKRRREQAPPSPVGPNDKSNKSDEGRRREPRDLPPYLRVIK
jgi:stringent starvation protein B